MCLIPGEDVCLMGYSKAKSAGDCAEGFAVWLEKTGRTHLGMHYFELVAALGQVWPARTRRCTQLQIFRCRVLPLHRRTISGCSSGCNDFFRLVTDGSPCTLVPRVQDRLYSPRFQAAWFQRTLEEPH